MRKLHVSQSVQVVSDVIEGLMCSLLAIEFAAENIINSEVSIVELINQ